MERRLTDLIQELESRSHLVTVRKVRFQSLHSLFTLSYPNILSIVLEMC